MSVNIFQIFFQIFFGYFFDSLFAAQIGFAVSDKKTTDFKLILAEKRGEKPVVFLLLYVQKDVTYIGDSAFKDCSILASVTFDNPNGWWYSTSSSATSGTAISSADLEDHEKAAEYLRSTYASYYWRRG